ncbi:MAG: hypothetical protein LEGION0398_MBIBDBAK_00318 [Legionellaceae bacterium]
MEFEQTNPELEDTSVSADDLLADGTEFNDILSEATDDADSDTDLDFSELDGLSELEHQKKEKSSNSGKRSLKVRRAIEDFFEDRKMKQEFDYLIDTDEAIDENENENQAEDENENENENQKN